MDVVEFAKKIMQIEDLESWEEDILRNYKEFKADTNYWQWIRPTKRENQFLLNIYLSHKEYLSSLSLTD